MIEWFCQTGRRRCNRDKAEETRRCRGQNPFTLHSSDQWTRLPLASSPPLPLPPCFAAIECAFTRAATRWPLPYQYSHLRVSVSAALAVSVSVSVASIVSVSVSVVSAVERDVFVIFMHITYRWIGAFSAPSAPLLHLSFAPFLLALLVVCYSHFTLIEMNS